MKILKILLPFLLFTLISNTTFATVSNEGKELKGVTDSARKLGVTAKLYSTAAKDAFKYRKTLGKIRMNYEDKLSKLAEKGDYLLKQGKTKREVAEYLHGERRRIGEVLKNEMPTQAIKDVVSSRNINKHGDKLGPTFEKLIEKAKKKGLRGDEIYDKIITSSAQANKALTGRIEKLSRISGGE